MSTTDEHKSLRRIALFMLLLAVIGQLAYAKMVYNSGVGIKNHFLLPGLAWLRWVVWAGWIAVLVRPGLRRLFVGLAAVVMVIAFVSATQSLPLSMFPRHETSAHHNRAFSIGENFTALQGMDIDGNVFSLDAYLDRPVLFTYWRSWCSPCLSEVPVLNELDNMETTKGHLAVIGVNNEPPELQFQIRERSEIDFRLLQRIDTVEPIEVNRFPTNIIVWRGRVLDWWIGAKEDLGNDVISTINQSK